MKRHANIAFFIPHAGCVQRCSFCDQRKIAGDAALPDARQIEQAVARAVRTKAYDAAKTEIAFFGGSFTAIEPDVRRGLLALAAPYVQEGLVAGIRVSTRPDAVTAEILRELKAYGVSAVELGAQSMDDAVLAANRRGHTARDTESAARLIRQAGLSLGLQMMTGLYQDTEEKTLETAKRCIALRPDTMRVYPTVVLEHTDLARLYREGAYLPQTLDQAVRQCAVLLDLFEEAGVSVIRVGLHSVDQRAYIDGPWHPAFGELCASARYLKRARRGLRELAPGRYTLFVSPDGVSKMAGQRRENIRLLAREGYLCKIRQLAALSPFAIKIQCDEGSEEACD